MKKNNSMVIIAFSVMALFLGVVVFGVIRLVSPKGDKPESSSKIRPLNLDDQKKVYTKKINAYNDQIQDSIIRVSNENVKVDLKKLWGKKVNKDSNDVGKQLAEFLEKPKEEIQPKPKPQVKTKIITKRDTVYLKDDTTPTYKRKNGFYSSQSNDVQANDQNDYMYLVVHESTKVTSGSVVKLRTIKPFEYNGVIIPIGTFINGVAQLSNERVLLKFASFAYDNQLFPLRSFTAYDPDGWEGVHVPGLVANEALKDAVNQTTARTQINIPVIGDVALNTARNENNKGYATLAQDYPVILKRN
jgi:gas vesicle protein